MRRKKNRLDTAVEEDVRLRQRAEPEIIALDTDHVAAATGTSEMGVRGSGRTRGRAPTDRQTDSCTYTCTSRTYPTILVSIPTCNFFMFTAVHCFSYIADTCTWTDTCDMLSYFVNVHMYKLQLCVYIIPVYIICT